jgi:hypothetical protein
MLYAIIEKATGKELYYKENNVVLDTEVAVDELRTEDMDNPYFDFTTRKFYDKTDGEN